MDGSRRSIATSWTKQHVKKQPWHVFEDVTIHLLPDKFVSFVSNHVEFLVMQELAALFKSDDVVEEDQKEKTEQDDEEKKEDKDDPPKELGEREDDQKKESDAVKEMEREADKDAHRHRPISPNRQPRRESRRGSVSPKQRSRRRSISPRYRSSRQYSPYRERESDRSRRTSSYRRSKDQEDRYRYRR